MYIMLKVIEVFSDSLDSPENLERLWAVTPFWRVTNVDQSFLILGDNTLHFSRCHPEYHLTYHLNVMFPLPKYFLGMGLEILPCQKLWLILKSSKRSKEK